MPRSPAMKRAEPARRASRPAKATAPRRQTPRAVQPDLRATLLARRAELIAKLREEREGRREVAHREKIEGTPFGDRPALSPDDEMGFAVADRRVAMVGEIDLALKKMDEGNYGRCEICEEPINVLRLQAHPFAVRCTRCQEAWEREQTRSEPGGGRLRTAAGRPDVSEGT